MRSIPQHDRKKVSRWVGEIFCVGSTVTFRTTNQNAIKRNKDCPSSRGYLQAAIVTMHSGTFQDAAVDGATAAAARAMMRYWPLFFKNVQMSLQQPRHTNALRITRDKGE